MYSQYNIVSNHPHIPEEAFLFVPKRSNNLKERDDFRIGQGKSIRRLLFEGWSQQTYTPYQLQKLKEFQEFLLEKKITLDKRWDRQWRIRWLLACGCNHKKTIEDMNIYISYQNNLKNITLTNYMLERLSTGIFYIGGRDSHYRPMLIFDVEKIVKLDLKQDDIIETITFFFQYVMKNYLIPGQVQNWVSIIDVGYTGLMSLVSSMKKPMGFLSNTYRSRMFVCYVVQIPTSISFFWGIAKNFLEEQTVRKINFFDQSKIEPLLEFCNPSQLQQKFGGTMKKIENYWPPRQYSKKYSCQKEPIKSLTKQQYTEHYKNKTLYNTKFHEQNLILTTTNSEMIQNKNQGILKKIERQLKIQLLYADQDTLDHSINLSTAIQPTISYQQLVDSQKRRFSLTSANNNNSHMQK